MIPVYLMLALLPSQVNATSYVSSATNPPNPKLRQMLLAESQRQRPDAIRQTQIDLAKVEKKLAALRGRDLWSFLQPPRNADMMQECQRTIELLHERLQRLQSEQNACVPMLKITDWRVGRAGVLGFPVKIKEIRSADAMLVEPQDDATDKTSPEEFLLRGYDTSTVKPGDKLTPAGYFAVSGTTTEPAFLLGRRTLFVVEAVK
jgi:hypothetical protein